MTDTSSISDDTGSLHNDRSTKLIAFSCTLDGATFTHKLAHDASLDQLYVRVAFVCFLAHGNLVGFRCFVSILRSPR